ncbi:hypothetical protein [Jatrophihabitans sp.]|uniref:hypothetical protein n=1 Tax=Jatrophihabitans sp. TaxID=1932789 RepID=UPI0030C7172E|nr:hypothetical protein [Jatrophihabitans sp.]
MWFWTRITRKSLVTDLGWATRGVLDPVLVTLRVPRELVLMSGFDAWHHVLNGLPSSGFSCSACGSDHTLEEERVTQADSIWFKHGSIPTPRDQDGAALTWWRWPHEPRSALVASWDAIFDLPARGAVQGCMEHIASEWVIDAVTVVARTVPEYLSGYLRRSEVRSLQDLRRGRTRAAEAAPAIVQ